MKLPRRRSTSLAIAAVLLGLIAVADFVTGPAPNLSVFYAVPVTLAAWGAGLGWGLGLTVLAWGLITLSGLAAGHLYSTALAFHVETLVVAVTLGVLSLLMARLRVIQDHDSGIAAIDPLTGLKSRSGLAAVLEQELERHRRYKRSFSIVLVDCDGFKSFALSRGAATGDELLRRVGDTLGHRLRKTDALGRIGNDEFAVLLPETRRDDALLVAHDLRSRLDAMALEHGWAVTFSIGVVIYMRLPDSPAQALELADTLAGEIARAGKGTLRETTFE